MSIFSLRPVNHVLFWVSVFAYFMITSSMVFYRDYVHLVQSTITLMIPQITMSYLLLGLLIPKFLYSKRYLLFSIFLLVSIFILLLVYLNIRKHYFDEVYFDIYTGLAKEYAQLTIAERLLDLNLLVSKSVLFLSPAALLFTYRMFKDQQNLIKLREQKRVAELTALKNQLNPHFLFNTLNNLYALALEGSKKTPEMIERLSEILDYMLYGCNENYVAIDKELTLIENYLALEKIRYGKRVKVVFENSVSQNFKIAPLVLLTFIENAFKHGVSQELGQANIKIELRFENKTLVFTIQNTKPKIVDGNSTKKAGEALGLVNAKKQLELLYHQEYELHIEDHPDSYRVRLKIPVYGF